eukprot:10743997-Alexandrium_andersonii.AAC.1
MSGSLEPLTGTFCAILCADSESEHNIGIRAPRSPEKIEHNMLLMGRKEFLVGPPKRAVGQVLKELAQDACQPLSRGLA